MPQPQLAPPLVLHPTPTPNQPRQFHFHDFGVGLAWIADGRRVCKRGEPRGIVTTPHPMFCKVQRLAKVHNTVRVAAT